MEDLSRIKELIGILNKASDKYYNEEPIMTDREWDKLYDKLVVLENKAGLVYPNSPTHQVGYAVVNGIEKVKLNHPMLSLDKCHSEQELMDFAGDKKCLISVKCDGLSTSLHYINGKLVEATSRGNGIEGGNVLHNVMTIANIPHTIPYKEELIIDGETIIDWASFKQINDNLPIEQEKYKHPRNLVSGSLNVLDSKIAASRNMRFIAWRVIKGIDSNSVDASLNEIEKLGFEVVPRWEYCSGQDNTSLSQILNEVQTKADELKIPYDGAVITYDDINYGASLGRTDKFFRHSLAYKYEDKLYETTLRDIDWNTSRTGLINPIAVFDETIIDNTSVTKATLHNLSYIENLQLGIGDTIRIYKSNQIIPKLHDNLTKSNTYIIPRRCPCCGCQAEIHNDNGSKTLHCRNPYCSAKLLAKCSHFCSKNAMNIIGLSDATLQFLIDKDWINDLIDIYNLERYKDEWICSDGFGEKSVLKILENINNSTHTELARVLYGVGIPLIGKSVSRDIARVCKDDVDNFIQNINLSAEATFGEIDGFGTEMSRSLNNWWDKNSEKFLNLVSLFSFKREDKVTNQNSALEGFNFVITGSLERYKNRDELVKIINSMGGKVVGSVSAKTNYLINNDVNSTSSKNKKAKELGIPIINEYDFQQMIKS